MSGDLSMVRAKSMCKTCIFRGIGEDDFAALAALPPDHVPCHTLDPLAVEGIQCRGHWEARRKTLLRSEIDQAGSKAE